MKKSLSAAFVVAAGVVMPLFADVSVVYTSGDVSLADGKLLFEYDDSGKIERIAISPTAGESLTLSGDTLALAADAKFDLQYDGLSRPVVIANDLTVDGQVVFAGKTNMTWSTSGRGMKAGSFELLFKNVSIDEIKPVASVGISNFLATNGRPPEPFHVVRGSDGDVKWMKFELQSRADNGVRGVYVALRQDGESVHGRILAARYTNTLSKYGEAMFVSGEGSEGWSYSQAENYTNYKNIYASDTDVPSGFGIVSLTVGSRYGMPTLTFAVSGGRTLKTVSGGGVDVTFDANAFGKPEVAFTSGTLRCTQDWMTFTNELKLNEMTLRTGSVYGSFIDSNSEAGAPAIVVGWESDGKTASCQFQQFKQTSASSSIVRGVDVELRQNGDVVEIKWVRALYLQSNVAAYYGKQKLTVDTPNVSKNANSSAKITVNWASTIASPVTINAVGENKMVDSSFVVKGDGVHPIVFDVMKKYAMPPDIHCYGNSTLNISAEGGFLDGVSRYTDRIVMHEGSKLLTSSAYPFHYADGEVVLNGATLAHAAETDAYLNYMTLKDGSAVDASIKEFRVGFNAVNPKWTVSGTCPSTYTGGIYLIGGDSAPNDLTVYVSEFSADGGALFTVNGNVTVYSGNNNFRSEASLIKTGSGTMEILGTLYTTNRPVQVREGVLLLGKTGATAAAVPLSLQGGTLGLAGGTVNEVADVDITADSTVSLEVGAMLSIGNLTIPEGVTLSVEVDGNVGNRVKVASSLPSATLTRIRLNGRRARQNAKGFLYVGGMSIVIR